MLEKINEMIEMQKALDKAIYKEHGTQFDAEKCRTAIIDELGELTHELKANWCWWKKTQKPVDNAKVLEELVDVWHFVMCYTYHLNDEEEYFVNEYYDLMKEEANDCESEYSMHVFAVLKSNFTIETLLVLSEHLGFTIDDIYNAYISKNKINYERLASGY